MFRNRFAIFEDGKIFGAHGTMSLLHGHYEVMGSQDASSTSVQVKQPFVERHVGMCVTIVFCPSDPPVDFVSTSTKRTS